MYNTLLISKSGQNFKDFYEINVLSKSFKKVQTADNNGVTTVVYGVFFQFRAENPRTALYLFSRDSVLSSVHGVVIDSLTCHYVVFWKMARNIFFLVLYFF